MCAADSFHRLRAREKMRLRCPWKSANSASASVVIVASAAVMSATAPLILALAPARRFINRRRLLRIDADAAGRRGRPHLSLRDLDRRCLGLIAQLLCGVL